MLEPTLLIIEDETAIREMLHLALSQAGFLVTGVADIHQAKTLITHQLPDLILLDWMLPGASGIELVKYLKKEKVTQFIPIIMLTARDEENDKIRGFEVGVDDYVTKPFSPRELIARIKAVLRRFTPLSEHHDEQLVVKDLLLDPHEHRVKVGQKDVAMGPTEFRLLYFFMQHQERVYSRTQVLDNVWGQDSFIEERTVDVHIRRLRKALASYGYDHLVQTVRGVGYRFSTRE